ncbi:hypothetical protein D3C85_1123500 [compost metagenome]
MGGVQLALVVGQQVATDNGNQVATVAELFVDHQRDIEHQGVQVGVVAADADLDFSKGRTFDQDLLRGLLANDLHPAFVDVLQQRIGGAVGVRSNAGAVPADHDAVEADLLLHSGGILLRKVGELGPGVDGGVFERHVALGIEQLVTDAIESQHVTGDPVVGRCIDTARDGAVDADHDLLALDLGHCQHVDALQESRTQGDFFIQGLRMGRLDVEFFMDRGHRIGGRNGQCQGAEFQAGSITQIHQ